MIYVLLLYSEQSVLWTFLGYETGVDGPKLGKGNFGFIGIPRTVFVGMYIIYD